MQVFSIGACMHVWGEGSDEADDLHALVLCGFWDLHAAGPGGRGLVRAIAAAVAAAGTGSAHSAVLQGLPWRHTISISHC